MGTLAGDQSKYKYCQVTSIVRSQVLSGHTMMKVVIFCLVLVTFAAADFHVHVDEEDRTFCQLSTRNACAAACNGQACTEQCIPSCGIFSRPFTYTCSAVAASTCSSTAPTPTPAPASPAPVASAHLVSNWNSYFYQFMLLNWNI